MAFAKMPIILKAVNAHEHESIMKLIEAMKAACEAHVQA